MKIICQKEKLASVINIVQKAVSSKTTLPILEGILIETIESGVKLTSNDLEIGIECLLEADVREKGAVVVESKMFGEIIRRLPDTDIVLYSEDNGIFVIECEGSIYRFVSLNSDEFPRLPEVTSQEKVSIKQNILKEMIRETIFSVSIDENRPIFTGCLLEIEEGMVNMVSVDGFRLSLRRQKYEGEAKSLNVVIPGKTLNEIFKILQNNDEEINISVAKNQALFEMKDVKIVSRILEGEFLNYKAAVPVEKEIRIKVNKDVLLSAFERIYLLTRDEKKYPVKLKTENNTITIMCSSTIGNAKEEISAEIDGKDIEIGFNPKYFIDALKVIEKEQIYIDLTTSMAPGVIRPVEEEEFVYMILPVRIREENI
ncbi:MAG: DNA polymerase III subunit beta [Deltaproteobacteria bacterium]